MIRLSMSLKGIKHFKIIHQRQDRLIWQEEAALLAGLSVCQFRRIGNAYRKKGAKALIHGNTGKPSGRSPDPQTKNKILNLLKSKYKGFGPTLAAEMDGIKISPQSIWRYQVDTNLWPKPKKKKKHCQWREPKPYYGQMIQLDESEHDWLIVKISN